MQVLAGLVHVFTALGAVTALLALLAVANQRWEEAFAWLGLAFIIDGLDGTLARAARVKVFLPRFSGERLDLIIDYVTYVFVPTYALIAAGYLPGILGLALACGILLSSLFHFSDEDSKAEDHSFVGFPAIWNIVAFYIFVLKPAPMFAQGTILVLILLTFVPMKWVHPLRVEKMKAVTLAATVVWAVAAAAATWGGFEAVSPPVLYTLVGVAIYGIGLAIWSSLRR